VTFDPFGDFETRGYLRNLANEKDPDIVRRLEHASFMTGIDAALERLAGVKQFTYSDLLETHRIPFDAVYPWAGQDRLQTAPDLAISKGPILFARPEDMQRAVEFALARGRDKKVMASNPGEIMGYLAYAHPFLDGNGRTIMLLHAALAHRAGFSINWAATGKADYLSALTKELDNPGTVTLTHTSGPSSARPRPMTNWRPKSRRRLVLMGPMNKTKSLAKRATQP
jgi:cell filamentation protein